MFYAEAEQQGAELIPLADDHCPRSPKTRHFVKRRAGSGLGHGGNAVWFAHAVKAVEQAGVRCGPADAQPGEGEYL